jgi:hypothetical protein
MVKQWLSFRDLAALAVVVGLVAVLAVGAQAPTARPAPGTTGTYTDMAPRAIGPLNQAYDMIGAVTVWMRFDHEKLSSEHVGLLEQAKDFYKQGHKAFHEGQDRRATELALAASDAARGLLLMLSAKEPKIDGLPTPPTGMSDRDKAPRVPDGRFREPDRARPSDRAPSPGGVPPPDRPPTPPGGGTPPAGGAPPRDRDSGDTPPRPGDRSGAGGPAFGRLASMGLSEFLREVRDQIDDASSTRGRGEQFIKAAREALEEAQKSSNEGHYRRAFHCALAAESWARVPEHLRRAETGSGSTAPGGTPGPRPPR